MLPTLQGNNRSGSDDSSSNGGGTSRPAVSAGLPALAFFTIRDIGQLQAVSFAHTTALWNLGYGGGAGILQGHVDMGAEPSDYGSDCGYGSSYESESS